MNKIISYEFTDKDIELLKKDVPESPCGKCRMGGACCGCPEHREWKEKYYNPLRDAGLDEVFTDVNQIKEEISEMIANMHDLKKYISKMMKKYPGLLQHLICCTNLVDAEADLSSIKGMLDSESMKNFTMKQ